jgi:hypothetical protein
MIRDEGFKPKTKTVNFILLDGGILMQDYSWDFCPQVPSTMQMTYNLIKA